MQAVWQDIRYGVRMLVKKPGFTVVALLTLALGIAITTATFTVVDAVLLRKLPVSDSGSLVVIHNQLPKITFPVLKYQLPNSLTTAVKRRPSNQPPLLLPETSIFLVSECQNVCRQAESLQVSSRRWE